jgi:NADH-quinone oxidoreductase subunit M
MSSAELPLLTLLLLAPLAGALVVWLVPGGRGARWVALGTGALTLALALGVLARLDPAVSSFQLVERAPWIPTLGASYALGVDGISALFLPLTALAFLGAVVGAWTGIRSMPRLYYSLLLLLETANLGVFVAIDTLLFFLFWELTLVPLYFLISLWGVGPNRRYAAAKYTLVMLMGGVPLLFGLLVLAFGHATTSGHGVPAGLTFDYVTLLHTPLPTELERAAFLLLLLGFAFKAPVFPLHTWLPVVAQEGPVTVVALLAGLKLGAYGLLRFTIPLAPHAAAEMHWLLAGLGVVGILYGALAALAQTNLRRMLAYSSLSHVGLVVLALGSLDIRGVQGAVFQLLNFTLVAGGLFTLTGMLHHRLGTTELVGLGGAARTMPLLASFYLLLGLAAIGLPGTSGFPAELLMLVSALGTHPGAGIAALFGVVIGAAYFLGAYRRAFLGPVTSAVVGEAADLRPRELAFATVVAVLVLAAGVYPEAVLQLMRSATEAWAARLPAAG